MPTYDYQCTGCGHAFEKFQPITAAPLKKCPACEKNRLRRLIGTGAAVLFKGGGFYETDYRSESYRNDAKKDQPAEVKSDKPGKDGKGGRLAEPSKPADGTSNVEAKPPTPAKAAPPATDAA